MPFTPPAFKPPAPVALLAALMLAGPAPTQAAPPPPGLWLLTDDADGQPTLVAPSSTDLPAGHPGRVRLLACGQANEGELPAVAVPAGLIEWLSTHSASVYVLRMGR